MIALRNIVICVSAFSCFGLAGAAATHLPHEVEQADPISGLHWHRMVDPKHPAAPPRLTLVRESSSEQSAHREVRRATICVRAGDRVSLRSADSRLSRFSLEATALESGACGARVRARVNVTRALVEMTVLDSGTGLLGGKADAWH